MSELLLDIKDLWVEYRSDGEVVHAVNGVNLTLNKKETLGIVGETGAGKTTTALSILRLLPERTGHITKGSIIFDNTDLLRYTNVDMQAVRGERIAMIFQDPMTSLNPVLPVGRQIFEALELHNSSGKTRAEMDARVDAMLELVGIPARRKKEYPHQFSGGQRQRIGIARALAVDPQFIVADEPVSALDVSVQSQIVNLLQDIQKQTQVAFLFIAHDLAVVEHISHRIMVMYLGKLAETGPARELCSKPAHPYTKALLSSVPSLDPKHKIGRIVLKGDVPSPLDPPKGCRFHPRCPMKQPICEAEAPILRQVPGASCGHCSACHFAEKVASL